MAIEWTEELGTGVAEIDDQHKELFRRINCLLDACGQGKGRHEVGRMIGFLDDYVISHFSAEERSMLEGAYPQYDRHRQEHEAFIAQMTDLKQKFHVEGSGVHVVLLTIRTSVDWLATHIRKTDRAMGAYLREKSVQGRA